MPRNLEALLRALVNDRRPLYPGWLVWRLPGNWVFSLLVNTLSVPILHEDRVRDMHTVEILMNRTDLRDQMGTMRVWLDERRYETSVFNYHQDDGEIVLTVAFDLAEEAEAFANRFAGRLAGNQYQGSTE